MKIPVDKILVNPEQPRKNIDPDELHSLAVSIREHGLINPISVEKTGELYILIDGERRWRAHMLVGLKEIEASIRPPMDGAGQSERLILAMIGNLQRTDLNPIEEAQSYKHLREMGLKIPKISEMVSKSPGNINWYLRLLELKQEVQLLYAQHRLPLSSQVVAALLALPEEMQEPMANGFARRRTGINGILNTCKRMMNKRLGSQEKIEGDYGPGMQLAYQQAKSRKAVGQWNALSHVKRVPPWPVIQSTALETCKGCAISDLASESNCRDCPLVDFLKILMAGGNQ